MLLKLLIFAAVCNCFGFTANGYLQVGLILKKTDRSPATIIEQVLRRNIASNGNSAIRIVREVAEEEDARSYHRAFCRLLSSGIDVFITPAAASYSSILIAYAHEYNIPLITPELPEVESEMSRESNTFSFGIGQSTSRTMLHLFQLYGWKNVVYLYDHESGPENLHNIYLLGYRVLNLTLDGILKVTSAEEASQYLLKLDKSFKSKLFHVVLDTETSMAREIIRRHVNDIHVRKKNFHFVLSRPTTEAFWMSEKAAFGAINVTALIVKNQLSETENFIQKSGDSEVQEFKISSYYYYDAALVLREAANKFTSPDFRMQQPGNMSARINPPSNCLDNLAIPRPNGVKLSKLIKETSLRGVTGQIQFENGQRVGLSMNVTEITPRGFNYIGYWANGFLQQVPSSSRKLPVALPLTHMNNRLRIVSIIRPPYLMLKKEENGTVLEGNDRFEGYCKDMMDLLAKEMNIEYDLKLVEDGIYGIYLNSERRWSGIIGDVVAGKAELGVADLTITGERQRVVDFTDPFEMVGFSLVMKNPRTINKLSSMFFFLSAFTVDVWICILFAVLLYCVLFYFITKFTGPPDSIESASGIWGRKHSVVVNTWFTIGSSLFQGTGVYPRSISSRILSGFFWFFTLVLSALFIASITAQILTGIQTDDDNSQLSQLKALSLESIISEAVTKGWPKLGVIQPSDSERFIKRSKLPTYMEFANYLTNNPDVVVNSPNEGLERVRKSTGDYMVLLESVQAEYAIRRQPCDVVATHDSVHYSGYGIASSLGSPLSSDVNSALHAIQRKGALGHLHRKWWIDSNECQNVIGEERSERTIHVFSGLLCFLLVGVVIVLSVFVFQYIRRNQNKESRRQQLSFEDMNLGQQLPTPPPELLAEPTPVLNLPEYDKKTLL